jgi:hypothetical protein
MKSDDVNRRHLPRNRSCKDRKLGATFDGFVEKFTAGDRDEDVSYFANEGRSRLGRHAFYRATR